MAIKFEESAWDDEFCGQISKKEAKELKQSLKLSFNDSSILKKKAKIKKTTKKLDMKNEINKIDSHMNSPIKTKRKKKKKVSNNKYKELSNLALLNKSRELSSLNQVYKLKSLLYQKKSPKVDNLSFKNEPETVNLNEDKKLRTSKSLSKRKRNEFSSEAISSIRKKIKVGDHMKQSFTEAQNTSKMDTSEELDGKSIKKKKKKVKKESDEDVKPSLNDSSITLSEMDTNEYLESKSISKKRKKESKNEVKQSLNDISNTLPEMDTNEELNSNSVNKKKKKKVKKEAIVEIDDDDPKLQEDVENFLKTLDFSQFHQENKNTNKVIDLKSENPFTNRDSLMVNNECKKSKVKKEKKSKDLSEISPVNPTVETTEETSTKKKKKKFKSKTTDDSDADKIISSAHESSEKESVKPKFDKKQLSSILDQDDAKNTSIKKKNLSLKDKMTAQMNAAQFRFLNEQLYNCSGSEAKTLFKDNKEAFFTYHDGYQSQVQKWPVDPLSLIIKWLQDKPKSWTVADFGCGEARLEKSVDQNVLSLDLVAVNDKVIECDMSNTPLKSNSVDAVVFCLSLMGTNINDFILEANRVLMPGGLMKIAEVESRFNDIKQFTSIVSSMGFKCIETNQENEYFWFLEFKKVFVPKKQQKTKIKLNPCIYKKR